ncbi:hypothetical protein [Micromonospora parathelypteridis]|uniref:hypothetical protein n=1 Tax=Micromonospora parathelypteridis TaxID=1839617 RepID=UPI00160D3461|nr:hypothetical protein [Micromonospora parathelypteridis]
MDDQDEITYRSRSVILSASGSFLRCIAPIRLDNGSIARFSIWVAILDDVKRVMAAGRAGGDAWASLKFTGVLANRLRPWPAIYRPVVSVAVSEPDLVPLLVGSRDPHMLDVLTHVWPHADVVRQREQHG